MSQKQAQDPEKYEADKNAAVAGEPRSDEVKCDNHPDRDARTFTGGGSYLVNLCEECTPSWFQD